MTLRVGYFPHNNSLFVLRHRGILERSIPDVEWVDLRDLPEPPAVDPQSGLPTLHSDWLFADGGYDVIGTGFTPPITALGAGHDVVYLGISGPRVENGRIVALSGSGITSPADLRGKRVGVAHGSWQTTLVLFALDDAGLTWADIEPVDVDVHAGGEALLAGEIDAWVGAYPGLAAVESRAELVTLVDTASVFSHPSLWFTSRRFAEERPDAVRAVLAALAESDAWVTANPREAAAYFADDAAARGLPADLDTWEAAVRGRPFGVGPVTEDFLDEQQRAADLFVAGGLLPRRVDVRGAVLPWIGEAAGAATVG
ncbi:ABC transporter substrate-binding protein [Tsukamurella tyrosinosolvens]|uniref:ABC transporter substrate-binding protein n=1 Tax=Tsukamurella tyrosinosolvens TaxID=57704 RepID=UPI001AF65168|nr:ABC transporter substrate-binding protein [Tsukamurella tyrosinosolvens]QRY85728.1 ABC transporter substrate-binding protein [Tsukamurella tyrosinosolvens]